MGGILLHSLVPQLAEIINLPSQSWLHLAFERRCFSWKKGDFCSFLFFLGFSPRMFTSRDFVSKRDLRIIHPGTHAYVSATLIHQTLDQALGIHGQVKAIKTPARGQRVFQREKTSKGGFGDGCIGVMRGQDLKTPQVQSLEEAGQGALGEQEPRRLTVPLPFHPEQSNV